MILCTGSAGYIGSHVERALLEYNYDFAGFDNLSTGSMANNMGLCIVGDITNKKDIEQVFENYDIDCVFHLAAKTSVPESMENPDLYYETNFEGTENLLQVMKEHNCNKLVFSSTASVYEQSRQAVTEDSPLQPLNHYAKAKLYAEQAILEQYDWLNAVIFRYFNVIGYDEDYDKSKEALKTNIVPKLLQCYESGDTFKIFGNNYPVQRQQIDDKTCVRDYIDVRDIAEAHLLAYNYMLTHMGITKFNLGTKHGTSVLELLSAFEKANNVEIKKEFAPRRKGDPASIIANAQKANEVLGWTPRYSLEQSLKVL